MYSSTHTQALMRCTELSCIVISRLLDCLPDPSTLLVYLTKSLPDSVILPLNKRGYLEVT